MGRLRDLARKVTGRLTGASAPVWAPEPTAGHGRAALDDGTPLERVARVAVVDVAPLLVPTDRRLRLVHHWAAARSDAADALPYLRDLHLGWAQSVDFVGVCWDVALGAPAASAARAADAWHRDYGLTWRSVVVEGDASALAAAAPASLPSVVLYDRDGVVVFEHAGAMGDEAGRALEAVVEAERWNR
jgi:hypothetical protein